MNDIKDVLGKAFTDEPPSGIHSDEVLRRGRSRLLRRRGAIFGGLAVAVVTAVVSASALSGAASPPNMSPAGPPRPGDGPPGSSCATNSNIPPGASLTAPPKICEPTSVEHAAELTAALAAADAIPADLTPEQPLAFTIDDTTYEVSTDLRAADGSAGSLHIAVMGKYARSPAPSCKAPATCDFRDVNGQRIQITTFPQGDLGMVATMVSTQHQDGSHTYASTSNVSLASDRVNGKLGSTPTIDHQPLTHDQLVKIVTAPGLEF